jgi:CRP-like cAMP-binding protein
MDEKKNMGAPAKKLDWDIPQITEELKSFPLLDGFPENLIQQLAGASQIRQVSQGDEILKQGALNDQLYFLSSGQVGVYVDGARVSKMQLKGDLLGEMSVITNKPAGATISAETDVTLVCVDSRVFLDMKGPQRDLYSSILYRIYAMVLADKLAATNQKAKHFEALNAKLTTLQWDLEEANRTLEKKVEDRTQKLEQQKAELMAGKNKLEDLIATKKFVFHKLSELHDNHLIPLKNYLDDLRKKNFDDPVVTEARKIVFDTQQMLGPLTDQYSSEQAVAAKKVLLCETNKKQQIIAKMALGGTGVVLEIGGTLEEAKAKIETTGPYDLIMLDSSMLELGNLAAEKHPEAQLVLMTSEIVPKYLPELRKLSCTPHVVSRNEEDRTFTIKNILTTAIKLLGRDLFGLEKYIAWGVDVQSDMVVSSSQRSEVLEKVDKHFEKLGVRRSNRDRMKTVLEEMLMNCIYDAPTDKDGKALYNHLPRTTEVSLKPEEQAIVRYATDGMIIAISVVDPFGSLKGSTLLKYLEHNYAGTSAELNASEGKGGAGRGLHQIVENSDLVVFNVDPGKKTEAIALFNVEAKEAINQTPTFHFFEKR